jgi:type VI secretion system secreted protein Hcp
MSVDMFIKIDGIKGDSTDSKHKDWIEVLSYRHEIGQATGGSASAQGTLAGGRADHGDFTFTKRLDSASPVLYLYVCTAKPIPNIEFQLCRAMGDKTTFMIYTFQDSIIAGALPKGEAEGDDIIPLEEVRIRYGAIKWSYTPTDPKSGGKTGAAVQAGWSTLENKTL